MSKECGLYLWLNEKIKMWTVTNEEDELLIGMTDEDYIREFRFVTIRDRLDYEKKLNDNGYSYCDYQTFLI